MFDQAKNACINLIKNSAPWYVHKKKEGVIVGGVFESFDKLSVKKLKKLVISTDTIEYAYSQEFFAVIGQEIFWGSLIDKKNPKKTVLAYCLDYELATNDYYKQFCVFTEIDHDWESVADEMVENVEYALNQKDAKKRIKELKKEWDFSVKYHKPKKLAFNLRALTFEEILAYAKKK